MFSKLWDLNDEVKVIIVVAVGFIYILLTFYSVYGISVIDQKLFLYLVLK